MYQGVPDSEEKNKQLSECFARLSTPLLADACLRVGLPIRIAIPGIRPIVADSHIAGRALPVRHYGSVDIFLEALENGGPGDILVVDNMGRTDEGCVGDLFVLEAQLARLAGAVVWGYHRDSSELMDIGFPLFSYGTCAAGPQRLDPPDSEALSSARFGNVIVTRRDIVFGDPDGVLFVSDEKVGDVLKTAESIRSTERSQAGAILGGHSLREQLRFEDYLARREIDSSYTFRKHLRIIGGAIEE